MKVIETLQDREGKYGNFMTNALITQSIKDAFKSSRNWNKLPPIHKESLEMIASKIGRILNGNPNHVDSWHDIAGYAELVLNNITKGAT